jgi:hypothetical protein
MSDTSTSPKSSVLDFASLLLGTLGFTGDEFVSLGCQKPGGKFWTAVLTPPDAITMAAKIPPGVDGYFGVNPIKGPARKNAGRGAEADVTRLAALWCDLDVKPGSCQDLTVADAIVDELSSIVGTRPSAITHSGHGLHGYWPVDDGHVTDVAAARALLRRWGRLVAVVAETHGARRDSVYDLPRMLRVPGTYNNKASK